MNKVKLIREEHSQTQGDIAAVIETSPVNYSKKEAGSVKFSLIEAKKIADYFNVSIEELFFNDCKDADKMGE